MKIAFTNAASPHLFFWTPDDYALRETEAFTSGEFVIAAIRAEAQQRIIAETGSLASIHDAHVWVPKQLNPIAGFALLLYKMVKGIATPEDEAKALAMITLWQKVEAIRAHSNALESAFAAGQDIDTQLGWPE